jgi:hypothetical protein
MKDEFKKYTVKLSEEISRITMEFFRDNLADEEDTTDVINLVLSSHLSSMFNNMRAVCSDEESIKKVNSFISNIIKFISLLEPIEQVEKIDE